MSSSFEKYQKRRLITSYISVVISIALVLFLLGLLGLLVLNTKKVADHFKEKIAITIYLKESAKDVEIKQLEKSLAIADYTREMFFVSKEQAAEEHSTAIGENFLEFLGYNPLQNSIDVFLKADFVSTEKVAEISENLSKKKFIEEVTFDKPLITLLSDNIRKISLWILVISGLFTLIAVILINGSIRLSVYSKRFIIKTMQMVGATKKFIRKPFIWISIKLGAFGGLLALIGMGVVLYYLNETFPELGLTVDPIPVALLFLSVFIIGLLITWISTFFAMQRFLNLRTDELYY